MLRFINISPETGHAMECTVFTLLVNEIMFTHLFGEH